MEAPDGKLIDRALVRAIWATLSLAAESPMSIEFLAIKLPVAVASGLYMAGGLFSLSTI